MNVKLERSYRSRNGNVTFVYKVSGSATDLAKYKEIQGEHYREDESKNPLWFTTRCIGNSGKLIITTNNKVVADMSEFDQAASLAQQYGGNFGAELAKAAAQKITGGAPVEEVAPAAPEAPAPDISEA